MICMCTELELTINEHSFFTHFRTYFDLSTAFYFSHVRYNAQALGCHAYCPSACKCNHLYRRYTATMVSLNVKHSGSYLTSSVDHLRIFISIK